MTQLKFKKVCTFEFAGDFELTHMVTRNDSKTERVAA